MPFFLTLQARDRRNNVTRSAECSSSFPCSPCIDRYSVAAFAAPYKSLTFRRQLVPMRVKRKIFRHSVRVEIPPFAAFRLVEPTDKGILRAHGICGTADGIARKYAPALHLAAALRVLRHGIIDGRRRAFILRGRTGGNRRKQRKPRNKGKHP